MATKLNENTEVALPLRNIISLVAAASVATWAYFGIIERLNQIETNITMMEADLGQNTEFRIKWPRGELGQASADQEQYLLIEHLSGQVETIQGRIEKGMSNGVNIKRLQEDVKTLRTDVETLKDKQRGLLSNGTGG